MKFSFIEPVRFSSLDRLFGVVASSDHGCNFELEKSPVHRNTKANRRNSIKISASSHTHTLNLFRALRFVKIVNISA